MRARFLGTMMLLTLVLSVASGRPGIAQSTAEMGEQAHQSYLEADRDLHQVYQKILARLDAREKDIPEYKGWKDRMIDTQKAWIKFRDADAEARAFIYKGGTIWPVSKAGYLTETTRERTRELRSYLDHELK